MLYSMNKHTQSVAVIIGLTLSILILAFLLVWVNHRTKLKILDNAQTPLPSLVDKQEKVTDIDSRNDITVDNLIPGQEIKTPIIITGTVVGNWFFEGSFPVFMKDASGNQIGVGLATSSEDWMTTNTIPFSVTLSTINYQGQGSIVFTKDNPSGEAQFDASYVVPVVFQ